MGTGAFGRARVHDRTRSVNPRVACVFRPPRVAAEPELVVGFARKYTELGSFAESCLRDNRTTAGLTKGK